MSNQQIERILTAHYVPTMQTGGRIYGLEEYTDADGRPGAEWQNMTGWTAARLKSWLGY